MNDSGHFEIDSFGAYENSLSPMISFAYAIRVDSLHQRNYIGCHFKIQLCVFSCTINASQNDARKKIRRKFYKKILPE